MKLFSWIKSIFKKQDKSAAVEPYLPPFRYSVDTLKKVLMDWYLSQDSVKEGAENNTGKEVEAFQKTVDGISQKESWCMAFMQTGLLELCKWCVSEIPGLGHLTARELYLLVPIPKYELCFYVYTKCPTKYLYNYPVEGAWMIQKEKTSEHGHTGCVLKVYDNNLFKTIEGNIPESFGQGVDYRMRNMSGTPTKTVLGFINVSQAVFDTISENIK